LKNGDAALGTAVFAVVPEGGPNVVTEHSAHHAAADCTDETVADNGEKTQSDASSP
jgi:hypothetical protein